MDHTRQRSLVTAICLGTFMATLDISIVNVALPAIQASLQASASDLQWIIDAYTLSLSALILSSGALGDRFGRRRFWLWGVALFTLGSLICALSSTLAALLAGRVIQGIAAAAVIPGALSLITHAFEDGRLRARIIGIWSTVSALSLIAGPILGGLLVNTGGWASIFLINLPLGAVALVLGRRGLNDSKHAERIALHPSGQLLSIAWLGTLVYGLIVAGECGWSEPATLRPLAASALLLVLFICVERRTRHPLLPAGLFGRADMIRFNLASAVLGFSAYSSVFFGALFFQQVQGLTPPEAGWRMAPEFTAMLLGTSAFGRLTHRLSADSIAVSGFALMGAGLLCLALLHADSPYLYTAAGLAILGIGMGLAIPATGALVMTAAPRHQAGPASAAMNAARQAGMSLGIALLGTLMNQRAVEVFRHSLSGMENRLATEIARAAIIDHRLASAVSGLAKQVRTSLASGFSLAMLLAGLASLAMAFALWLLRPPAD